MVFARQNFPPSVRLRAVFTGRPFRLPDLRTVVRNTPLKLPDNRSNTFFLLHALHHSLPKILLCAGKLDCYIFYILPRLGRLRFCMRCLPLKWLTSNGTPPDEAVEDTLDSRETGRSSRFRQR